MNQRGLVNERGIALPAALIALLILSSLMVAFVFLAQTEPVIAANQARVAQARTFAESGLERGIWALNPVGGTPGGGGLAVPGVGAVAAAPYDGTAFMQVNVAGGFTLKITGTTANEVAIESVGWTPSPTSPEIKAHRKITATLQRLTNLPKDAPCALCVKGALDLSGTSIIDGRPAAGSPCGTKVGTYTSGATTRTPDSDIYGADGNNTANQGTDIVENQPTANFDDFTFTNHDLDALKALAKANGTYFRGNVTFNSSNKVKNGVVFVDTVSGNNIPTDVSQQNTSDFASVSINGNPFVDPTGFHGIMVVNGGLTINGSMTVHGLLYAVNDFNYTGTGTGSLNGLVISQNIRDTVASSVDTTAGGNSNITFNCADAQGAGYFPQGWFLQAGTYKEVSD
jgi:hypothetical protein